MSCLVSHQSMTCESMNSDLTPRSSQTAEASVQCSGGHPEPPITLATFVNVREFSYLSFSKLYPNYTTCYSVRQDCRANVNYTFVTENCFGGKITLL